MSDRIFWQSRIDSKKALILQYDAAIEAVTLGGMKSYTLDTGQSKQSVTSLDVDKLQAVIESLENQIAVLQQRISGCGTTIVRPSY